MAALLTSVLDNSDKVAEYINECRECGIALLPPDINRSDDRFTVEEGGIRFGLVAIKNIGRGFIQAVMAGTGQGRPFHVFMDFCDRIPPVPVDPGVRVRHGRRGGQPPPEPGGAAGPLSAWGRGKAEGAGGRKSHLPDIDELHPQQRMTMEKETIRAKAAAPAVSSQPPPAAQQPAEQQTGQRGKTATSIQFHTI